MDDLTKDKIKQEAKERISELIGDDVQLRRSGSRLYGCCPFHNEKTPSFCIEKGRYYCYGCGAGGDAVDYVMKRQGLEYLPALEYLARRFSIFVEPARAYTLEERKEYGRQLRQREQEKKREAAIKELCETLGISTDPQPQSRRPGGRLSMDLVERTERLAKDTPLFRMLCQRLDTATVEAAFRLYHVGGDKRGRTVFWQIDEQGGVRSGKIIAYKDNGHRDKTNLPTWVHSEMMKRGKLAPEFELEQCLFGTHLLGGQDLPQPVCLVESEKTAVIAACFMPQYTWIATGGMQMIGATLADNPGAVALVAETCRRTGTALTVFPDLNGGREAWEERLAPIKGKLPFVFSDVLEKNVTPKAFAGKFDLADFLLDEF